jgi:hypothetical protein
MIEVMCTPPPPPPPPPPFFPLPSLPFGFLTQIIVVHAFIAGERGESTVSRSDRCVLRSCSSYETSLTILYIHLPQGLAPLGVNAPFQPCLSMICE